MLPHPSKHLVCPPNHSRFIVFKSQRLCKNILHIHFTAPNSYTWDPWHEKHCTWSSNISKQLKHHQNSKSSVVSKLRYFDCCPSAPWRLVRFRILRCFCCAAVPPWSYWPAPAHPHPAARSDWSTPEGWVMLRDSGWSALENKNKETLHLWYLMDCILNQ